MRVAVRLAVRVGRRRTDPPGRPRGRRASVVVANATPAAIPRTDTVAPGPGLPSDRRVTQTRLPKRLILAVIARSVTLATFSSLLGRQDERPAAPMCAASSGSIGHLPSLARVARRRPGATVELHASELRDAVEVPLSRDPRRRRELGDLLLVQRARQQPERRRVDRRDGDRPAVDRRRLEDASPAGPR